MNFSAQNFQLVHVDYAKELSFRKSVDYINDWNSGKWLTSVAIAVTIAVIDLICTTSTCWSSWKHVSAWVPRSCQTSWYSQPQGSLGSTGNCALPSHTC